MIVFKNYPYDDILLRFYTLCEFCFIAVRYAP